MVCIPKTIKSKLIQELTNKNINLMKLSELSSEQRRTVLREFFKDDIGRVDEKRLQDIDAVLESNFILKNVEQGLNNWIEKQPADRRRDMLDKVARLTKQELLDPATLQSFKEDLVAQRLGVRVTMDQARAINDMSKDVIAKKETMENSPRREVGQPSTPTEWDFGVAKYNFDEYINAIKEKATTLSWSEYKNPKNWSKGFFTLAGIGKTLKATFDNSVLFRQGFKVLVANPSIWYKNAKRTFVDYYQTLKGIDVLPMVKAEINSHPLLNDMIRDKVDIGVREEAYIQSDIVSKIPLGIGKIHKAAETAFTAFAYRSRVALYEYYRGLADDFNARKTEAGKPTTDIANMNLGKLVNMLTGRGDIGILPKGWAENLNVAFFSVRNMKSNIDFLTMPFSKPFNKANDFIAKQAAKNLLRAIVGVSLSLILANAVIPGSVEPDSSSADFGKVKIGNTRFDFTGGIGSVLVLAMRIMPKILGGGYVKSSTTGIKRELSTGEFGQQTRLDMVVSFFKNKTSPLGGVIVSLLESRNYEGKVPTPASIANDLFAPIIAGEFDALSKDEDSANMLLALISEWVGIGINTYSLAEDWTQSKGKTLKQFRAKAGDFLFKTANDEYNKALIEWFKGISKTSQWQLLTEDNKQKTLDKEKEKIKKELFVKYNFHYVSDTTENSTTQNRKLSASSFIK